MRSHSAQPERIAGAAPGPMALRGRLIAAPARAAVRPRWAAAAALLATAAISLTACGTTGTSSAASKRAPGSRVVVSLTFDDGDESQYTLGFQHGLLPLGLHGTFYVVTGNTGNPGAASWSQLSYMYQHGNDIGGHTVHHIDLTKSSYSPARKAAEVCGSYRALVQHGLHPVSFSYPYGAYNTADERVAAKCGFRTARIAGGVDNNGPGSGPVYAETIPAYDPYGLRTSSNTGKAAPLVVGNLQRAVTSAARNGGGWIVLVFHDICSVSYDPADYGYCTHSWASIQLAAFDAFLEWLAHAGQPGGAPAGTIVRTVRQVAGSS